MKRSQIHLAPPKAVMARVPDLAPAGLVEMRCPDHWLAHTEQATALPVRQSPQAPLVLWLALSTGSLAALGWLALA